jgi:hypothetical protein
MFLGEFLCASVMRDSLLSWSNNRFWFSHFLVLLLKGRVGMLPSGLIPYAIMLWWQKGQKEALEHSELHGIKHSFKTVVTFALPALCDAGATTLLNVGLYLT